MSEELPDAISGWRIDAWELHKRRGWNFYRAYDHVLVRFLARGDARPLLDLISKLRRQPRQRTAKFIAAITNGTALKDPIGLPDLPQVDMSARLRHCSPLFEIQISERRQRGRPKANADDATTGKIRMILVAGFGALAAGIKASDEFWHTLGAALDPEGEESSTGRPFPFKAALVRKDGGTGRPHDPELEVRSKVLHAAVAKKIEAGLKYDAAVEEVRSEIAALVKSERAIGAAEIGSVTAATIRAAYDKLSRGTPRR